MSAPIQGAPVKTKVKRSQRVGVALAAAGSCAILPWALLYLLRSGHGLVATVVIVGVVVALALLLARPRRNG